jgi:hypothetical protein
MKEIHLKRRAYSDKDYKKRYAALGDVSTVVDHPCRIYFENKLAAVLLYEQHIDPELRKYVSTTKDWNNTIRGSGIGVSDISLGFQPRVPSRGRENCRPCKLQTSNPEANELINNLALQGEMAMKQEAPEIHAKQRKWIDENVLPDWQIKGSIFTGGVINKNNPMAYHKDRGNAENGWSAMYVLKNKMSGADLNVIDFDARIYLPDNSLLLFHGAEYMHGVTAMQPNSPDAYRYSIVFYPIESMKNCLLPKEEGRRAQIKRTEREMRRAGLIK